jgi:2-octaprenylphenol hydroxylase
MSGFDAEVLIVGGGVVGATLAGLLGSKGVECIVIDAARKSPAADAADPRVLAITLASANILRTFGSWDRLPGDRIGCFRRMLVWDANGAGRIEFDCADLGQSTLGYIVEQSVLQNTLDEVMDFFPSISVYRDEFVRALEWSEDYIRIVPENNRPLKARLVVAADGFNSSARDLAGIDYYIHDYLQSAVSCVVATEFPHENVARQRFLSNGPLAFLPMAAKNRCGIVWSTQPDHAQQLLEMEADEFNAALEEAVEHILGRVDNGGPRALFPLKRARAAHYCKDRLVLAGDAAHSIHPLAGQGANLGLLDAACLAQTLLQARQKSKDLGNRNILRKYERWRKGENEVMMRAMDGFKYLFEKQTEPLPLMRNTGMSMMDAARPVKHWIMRRAMGLAGDLPDAARV